MAMFISLQGYYRHLPEECKIKNTFFRECVFLGIIDRLFFYHVLDFAAAAPNDGTVNGGCTYQNIYDTAEQRPNTENSGNQVKTEQTDQSPVQGTDKC